MTKTIDIKSLLIGFLLAISIMLFMGHTSLYGINNPHDDTSEDHTINDVYHMAQQINNRIDDLEEGMLLLAKAIRGY